jgi:hypothetical protein
MFDLEQEIAAWRNRLAGSGSLTEDRLQELESHLRDEVEALAGHGLAPDEAWLIGVKRLGNVDAVAREFGKVLEDETWKRLVLDPVDSDSRREGRRQFLLTLVLCLGAALLAKLPALFGSGTAAYLGSESYFRNVALFFVPMVVLGWLVRRRASGRAYLGWALVFGGLALTVNLFPWKSGSQTAVLTMVHLPLVCLFAALFFYCAPDWRNPQKRLGFVRLVGEAVLYSVLLLCGLFALCAFLVFIFEGTGLKIGAFVSDWLLAMLGCAVPVVAVALAQAKRNVIENIAPILARIFTPLFLLVLIGYLVAITVLGAKPLQGRETLIVFDVMLAIVFALQLYTLSARQVHDRPGLGDLAGLLLLVLALVIDVLALVGIAGRIGEYGASANKLAALGENLVLLVDLAVLGYWQLRQFRGAGGAEAAIRWQTGYFVVLAIWMAVVALVFPLIFAFA